MATPPPNTRWIPGCKGRYALTRAGVVWSCLRAFPHPLKTRRESHGLVIELRRNGTRQKHGIAWLVLETFGPRRKPGQVPIHRNGDRFNGALDNLRWGTTAERAVALVRQGVYGRRLTPDDARRIYKSTRSAAVLAAEYGVSVRLIRSIWNDERWAAATRRCLRPKKIRCA